MRHLAILGVMLLALASVVGPAWLMRSPPMCFESVEFDIPTEDGETVKVQSTDMVFVFELPNGEPPIELYNNKFFVRCTQ